METRENKPNGTEEKGAEVTAPKIVQILSVKDTREYEEIGDTWKPIPGSGIEHDCDRCGKFHEVHATVLLEDTSTAIVGTGCMGKDNLELSKRFKRADRAAKRLAALRAEFAAVLEAEAAYDKAKVEVNALPLPEITEETLPGKVGQRKGEPIPVLVMGDAEAWILPGCSRTRERKETLASLWRVNRMRERGFSTRPNTAEYLRREIGKVEKRLATIAQEVAG